MGILAWFRKRLQTRAASDRQEPPLLRKSGTAAAYRRTVGLYLLVQVLLWGTLTGIGLAERTLWQSALLLIPAGTAVWAVSRWAWGKTAGCAALESAASITDGQPGRGAEPSAVGSRHRLFRPDTGHSIPKPDPSRPGAGFCRRPWEGLLLLPVSLLDGVFLLHTLMSLLHRLMPSYPMGILRVCIPVLLMVGVLLGKNHGTACGVSLWRWLLPLVAGWVFLSSLTQLDGNQLYPLLGKGWKPTMQAWAAGLGSLWPVGLLFLLPGCGCENHPEHQSKKMVSFLYIILPLVMGVVCALALVLAAGWQSAVQDAGFRLLLLGRSSGGPMVSGLWALFWLLALMMGFCTCLMSGQKLLKAVWPWLGAWVWPVLAGGTAAGLLWLWPGELPGWVQGLLPWRLAVWALAAAWAVTLRLWQRKKRNEKKAAKERRR